MEINLREQLGISMGRVRLYPPDIVWIKNLRMEGGRPDVYPFFECEDCWVRINWKHLKNPDKFLDEVYVKNGRANLRLYEDVDGSPPLRVLRPEEITVRLARPARKQWIVKAGSCRLGDAVLTGRGVMKGKKVPSGRRMKDWMHTRMIMDELERIGSKTIIDRWYREYEDIAFNGEMQMDAEFDIDADDKTKYKVVFSGSAAEVLCRGVTLTNAELAGELRGRDLALSKIIACKEEGRACVSVSYNLDSKLTTMHGYSSLPGSCLEKLLPSDFREDMRLQKVMLNGSTEADLQFGPVKSRELIKHFTGHIDIADFSVRDIKFKRLRANVARSNDVINVTAGDAEFDPGTFKGNGSYNLATMAFSGSGAAYIDPDTFLTVIESKPLLDIIAAFDLGDSLVSVTGVCSGLLGDVDTLTISADIEADNFVYNDTDIGKFTSALTLADGVVTLEGFRLVRPEGEASGRLSLDVVANMATFDAVSDCDPRALTSIVNTGLVKRLDKYQIEGPFHIEAFGVIDYANFASNNVHATVSARKIGMKGVLADEMVFRCVLKNRNLEISDLCGVLYGGTYSGGVLFDLRKEDEPGYQLDLTLKEVAFGELVQAVRKKKEADYKGKVSGHFVVSGSFSNDFNRVESGTYELNIYKGELFEIPLLGGLSTYLSKIIPGFGYFSQTEFEASGLFRSDRIILEKSQLRGSVISVKAHGDYFYDKTLRIDVQVIPMRKGFIASTLRIITFPVTKLFEFTLQGSLDDPDWRPTNLPKKLFLKFD